MKVKELENGTLCLKGNFLEGAEEAFSDSRYIEAFALRALYPMTLSKLEVVVKIISH